MAEPVFNSTGTAGGNTFVVFPGDLLETPNRYGGQFLAIHINSNDDSTNSESLGPVPIVKDVDGEAQGLGTTIASKLSLSQGGSIQNPIRSLGEYATVTENLKTVYSIFLPVPMSVKTNYGVEYGKFNLGEEVVDFGSNLAGAVAHGVGGGMFANGLATTGISQEILGGILLSSSAAGKGLSQLAGNLAKLSSRKILNPHKELLFEGVTYRTFDFSYKLMARSEKESKQIDDIVRLLRYYMHPELAAGSIIMDFPSEFDLEFYYDDPNSGVIMNPYMPFISTCVLTSLDVDYSGSDGFSSFRTGAPVEVGLTMKFQETIVLTKQGISALANYQYNGVSPSAVKGTSAETQLETQFASALRDQIK